MGKEQQKTSLEEAQLNYEVTDKIVDLHFVVWILTLGGAGLTLVFGSDPETISHWKNAVIALFCIEPPAFIVTLVAWHQRRKQLDNALKN